MRRNYIIALATLGALLLTFALFRSDYPANADGTEEDDQRIRTEGYLSQTLTSYTAPGTKVTIGACQMVQVIVPGSGCLIPSGTKELENRLDLHTVGSVESALSPATSKMHLRFLPHRRFGLRSIAEPLIISERRLRCDGTVRSENRDVLSHPIIIFDGAPNGIGGDLRNYIRQSCR